MARSTADSQEAIVARLNHLLERARSVKPSTSIDPPLHVSDLIREDESLFDSIEGNDEARRLSVETAAKSLFYANLVSSPLIPYIRCSSL